MRSPAPTPDRVLVLGVGNILLEDEGVGVRAVEALLDGFDVPPTVEVVDGGTSGMDLLGTLCDREQVIIVDAIRADAPPGTIVQLVDDEVKRFFRAKISPHQLGISDLLAATTLMGRAPKALTLIGIVPERIAGGVALSATIDARVPDLVARVVACLYALGHAPRSRRSAGGRHETGLGACA